ncbi:MAG: hypothetical protein PQJ50_01615 [Spirochaetales bacterium]|nr:hypothetical protein [Spirochaetales bacterium]
MKKFKIAALTAITATLLTACISMGEMIPVGQVAETDSCYLVGRVNIDLPEEDRAPEKQDFIMLSFEEVTEKGESVPVIKDVPRNGEFYIELPKGKYNLKVITYLYMSDYETNAIKLGNSKMLAFSNVYTINSPLDLSSSQMAYIGDISLTNTKNAYGFTQQSVVVDNKYDEIKAITEGWLLDESGSSVTPENLSSQLAEAYGLADPYNHVLENMVYKFPKDVEFQTIDGQEYDFDRSKSMAIVCVDNDYGTWRLVHEMEDYAVEQYGANIMGADEITEKLPQYPAYMYLSDDSEDDELTFNNEIVDLYTAMGVTLDVDYMMTVNKQIGFTSNNSSGQKGQDGLLMRANIFDVEKGEFAALAVSGVRKKEEGLLGSVLSTETTEDKIMEELTENFIDQLYKD